MACHIFNVDIAVIVGVQKAILLHHLMFWIQKNQANNTNYINEKHWTYNSGKAFELLFPYFKKRAILRWLNELENDEYIISTSTHNKMSFDRTKWYSLTQKTLLLFEKHEGHKLCHSTRQIDASIRQIDTTIPDINTDIYITTVDSDRTTDKALPAVKRSSKKTRKGYSYPFEQFWALYPRKQAKEMAWKYWLGIRPSKELVNQIMIAVGQQIQEGGSLYPHGKNGLQYVKSPCSWLAGKCWTDEVLKGTPESQPAVSLTREITEDEANELLGENRGYIDTHTNQADKRHHIGQDSADRPSVEGNIETKQCPETGIDNPTLRKSGSQQELDVTPMFDILDEPEN